MVGNSLIAVAFLIKDVNHTFTKEAYAQNVTLTRMGNNVK